MWPFRRKPRPAPTGTLRLGEPSADAADYAVYTVGESRFPDTYASVWSAADDVERQDGRLRRWATLVPVHDPAYGVADLAVELDGMRACYLRPPHLGRMAAIIDRAHVAALEVPALVERGPAGPTVMLLIADEDPA
jgi:hypothetical protein